VLIKIISARNLGSYTFSFGSKRTLPLGSAMLFAPLHTDHYAFLNLKNAATKILSLLTQTSNLQQPNMINRLSYKIFQTQTHERNRFLESTASNVPTTGKGKITPRRKLWDSIFICF